jgi:hypothetical protein
MRPLSSSGSYITKSPGVRTRLAAGAATRGKTDADSSASSSSDASQPSPPPPQPAVPRRTVEQIVKRITRGKQFFLSFFFFCEFSKARNEIAHSTRK